MDPDAIEQLRAQVTAALSASATATTAANEIRATATADREAAAIALAKAAQDKVDADAATNLIASQLAAATTLINSLQARTATGTSLTGTSGAAASSAPATIFTLTPGQISPNAILNFLSKQDKSLYEKAILPFTIIFDGAIKNVAIFQDNLNQRAQDFGWNQGGGDIINIPDDKGDTYNLITKYGCLTTKDIKKNTQVWIGKNNRQSQNNQMFVKLIIESITTKVRQKISNEEQTISINGVRVGALIFKLIMNKTIIDTRATSAAFRRDLSNLDIFMATCNSNIETFNEHVNSAVSGLEARNEAIDDLLTHLFAGYKIASDTKFVAYIELQETQYMQGSSLSAQLLMTQALNDYNTKIINNTWGAPSNEQQQIVALSAELKTIKDSNIELSQSVLKKLKNGKQRDTSEDSWRSVRGSGPDTMVKDGKTLHWCTYHKKWNLHKTSDCKARLTRESRRSTPSSTTTPPTTPSPTQNPNSSDAVSYAATFAATMAAINEETNNTPPVNGE